MLLRRATTTAAFTAFYRLNAAISHHFSTASTTPPKPFSKIPWKHRSKAIQEFQKALTEYLHTTRSLPYLYAEYIARNSPHSLWQIVSKIPFSPSSFTCSFQRFLRYHPINELDFFLESIGLDSKRNGDAGLLLPANTFFLSDWEQFGVVCALAGLGFPWSKLGLLYKDGVLVFGMGSLVLQERFGSIKDDYGFNSVGVIGICLAFPRVLYGGGEVTDGLLSDLKVLFVDCGLLSCVDSVDAMLEVCEKVRIFYDLGCEAGKVGELMGRSKSVFVEYSKEFLVSRIEYFCKLNVRKDQIGLFLLSKPEVFGFDVEDRVISVLGFLEHFGMSRNELESLKLRYPHAFGRNRIANLPHVMRSMDLSEWFFEKMKDGDHSLFATYALRHTNQEMDNHYMDHLANVHAKRTHAHVLKKLSFLHNIGFGENKFAVKALAQLNSSASQLQQRFDCLLSCGIEYSKLCAMLRFSAKILNQRESIIRKKLEYLCTELGSSLQDLDVFPAYICYDLEKRIKPRYEMHKWLVEQGFCAKEYSLSTIIASSEKTFVARISRIHPDAAKMWQESPLRKGSPIP